MFSLLFVCGSEVTFQAWASKAEHFHLILRRMSSHAKVLSRVVSILYKKWPKLRHFSFSLCETVIGQGQVESYRLARELILAFMTRPSGPRELLVPRWRDNNTSSRHSRTSRTVVGTQQVWFKFNVLIFHTFFHISSGGALAMLRAFA